MKTYTIGYPFCGAGVGASGSDSAIVELLGTSATFRNVGGIDFDARACEDFRTLTGGAPVLCADVATLTPEELRKFWGLKAPDVVKSSPPCKAGSGLLPLETANTPEYQAMNRLGLAFLKLLLLTYPTREARPRLFLLENVPSLRAESRAAGVVAEMVALLEREGYVVDVRTHDLGAEGGLAQRRRRLAILARDPVRCPAQVALPPTKPLLGVGEVLGPLPWPDDPRMQVEREVATKGGKLRKVRLSMHRSPGLSWDNLVRLALIPPGGDWRDLPKRGEVGEWLRARGLWPVEVPPAAVERLEELLVGGMHAGKVRREVHRRQPVQPWGEPGHTVTGPGSAGPCAVEDPRVLEHISMGADNPGRHTSKYAVQSANKPARTVTGAQRVGSGGPAVAAVADPSYPPPRPIITMELALHLLAIGWEVPKGCLAPAILSRTKRVGKEVVLSDNPREWSWHRPLTTLELAVLQGLPPTINGQPLVLAGQADARWREGIGNGIPRGAAEAWGRSLLSALVRSDVGAGWDLLVRSHEHWVHPQAQ